MNSTCNEQLDQASDYKAINVENGIIGIPSGLNNFKQTAYKSEFVVRNIGTKLKPIMYRVEELHLKGSYERTDDEPKVCPKCGCILHKNGTCTTSLRHIPIGNTYSVIDVVRARYRCSNKDCEYSEVTDIEFKSNSHLLTEQLRNYAESLLAQGLTLKEVSDITGLHKNVVKDIDKARLEALYVVADKNGNRQLIKPEQQARYLGIDEFKLHDGYKYATHIIDLETGCALWIQEGKKKQVVYDFIEHVGLDWMSKVVAVSADMNSDFESAFKEKCPHLKIVYDYFHIVKNFNDKVISEVRKDEQKRLIADGQEEAAKALKHTKFIMTSSKERLSKLDDDAFEGKVISKGSDLFKKAEVKQTGSKLNTYLKLLAENKLLFSLDWVKNTLSEAYKQTNEETMRTYIHEIINYCNGTENSHFKWFARLLNNHLEGIVSHAVYKISNGKIEGINQKIKTIRRQSYGLPDDEYFFLKIMDATRQSYRHSGEQN